MVYPQQRRNTTFLKYYITELMIYLEKAEPTHLSNNFGNIYAQNGSTNLQNASRVKKKTNTDREDQMSCKCNNQYKYKKSDSFQSPKNTTLTNKNRQTISPKPPHFQKKFYYFQSIIHEL
ncbi:hypothetical protein ACB098_12G089400 [Castanea mollissima]